METVIARIVQEAKEKDGISTERVESLLRERCAETHDADRRISKRSCMAHYMRIRDDRTPFWLSMGIDDELDQVIVRALRSKPRRTASGVATITVLTKPYPCSAQCLYCPNDIRMPKSYLSDEPACQRAERNFFDPYLQVTARLSALHDLGHVTDKVEMIVLGGTFNEYPSDYQLWFIIELYRALNDFGTEEGRGRAARIREDYRRCYGDAVRDGRQEAIAEVQASIDSRSITYNEAWFQLYGSKEGSAGDGLGPALETASFEELEGAQRDNARGVHRMVGLVVETRPDLIDPEHLLHLRRLGCTKLQMGIQSLDDRILKANARNASTQSIRAAFELLRLFGFKSHIHYMLNLLGSTPDGDVEGYETLTSDPAYLPDEVKLYPCALVKSARLMESYDNGDWDPYDRAELVECLERCTLLTPPYTRISRMIRDISSVDIVAGNRTTNLRQMVESGLRATGRIPAEIRSREVAQEEIEEQSLRLEALGYETSNTQETFLQWVNDEGTLAGFLRLSFPHGDAVEGLSQRFPGSPIPPRQAMIREVHIYGRVSRLHEAREGTQHLGLGRKLVGEACRMAREAGYRTIAVISAVGTREYYESLGFEERGLYHVRQL